MKWKKIDGYNNRYSVNEQGCVRNDERQLILKPMISTSGYSYVHLVVNRKKYTCYVHRLIGSVFLQNPDNLPQIDHIDGNKQNNNVTNLRWVTASVNRISYGSQERALSKMRSVKAMHVSGKVLVFPSRLSASEYFKCSPSKIKYDHIYKKGNKKGWMFELL